jgi:hypothetical protein
MAFDKIFSEAAPALIQTDHGTEFLTGPVQDVFRKHNIGVTTMILKPRGLNV